MTVFSKMATHSEILERIKQHENVWPPPIPYKPKRKVKKTKSKDDSKDDDDEDRTRYITIKVKYDPADEDSEEYDERIVKFEQGTPEEWMKYRKQMSELFERLDILDDYGLQHNHHTAALRGKAKDTYTRAYQTRSTENANKPEGERLDDITLLRVILNDTTRKFFPNWENSAREQKSYMRTCLYMGDNDPEDFFDRLVELNDYIPYFPYREGGHAYTKLDDDELIDIADRAKKLQWHMTMLSQGKRPSSFATLNDAREYYTQLYNADVMMKKMTKSEGSRDKKRSADNKKRKKTDSAKSKHSGENCTHCGKPGHKAKDCWSLPENKDKRPQRNKKQRTGKEKMYSAEETANMLTKVFASMKKPPAAAKKRKMRFDDNNDELDNFMAKLDMEIDPKPDTSEESSEGEL